MMHHKGEVLGGRYALADRIAIGGMGEVWAATDTVLGRVVAIKVLRTDNAAALLARFRDEARHTAALSHSGVARVHDYGEDGANAFLVMELIPGEPLSAVLAREGKLPVTVALSYLAQTAEAVGAAHAIGVVHRDIKPGNLMILPDGTVKVTDFGIARAIDATSMTAVGQVIGTAQYMSPEQATGTPATASSDIYSLGVVGYEMLTGRPPFSGENPVALAMAHVHQPLPDLPASVPHAVRSLIERSLAKDPEDRPATAAIFASEARDLQRRFLPSPVEAAAVAALPATEIIADIDEPATSVMPAGLLVGSAPPILDRNFVRSIRSRRRIIISMTLLAALVVGLAFSQSGANSGSATDLPSNSLAPTSSPVTSLATTTTPPTTAVTSTTAATVLVDANVLIGLTKADATARLVALGLHVVEKTSKETGPPAGRAAKDIVVGVEPSGQVAPGATIILLVSGKK